MEDGWRDAVGEARSVQKAMMGYVIQSSRGRVGLGVGGGFDSEDELVCAGGKWTNIRW
jgi:hypothetical protein